MYYLLNARGEWLRSLEVDGGGIYIFYDRKKNAAKFPRSRADKIIAFLSGFGHEFRAEGV